MDFIECNETWQASRSINYLFIGVSFILCDCCRDVMYDVQIWYQSLHESNVGMVRKDLEVGFQKKLDDKDSIIKNLEDRV